MPIMRVSPQERKLIPLELQAQYELGRISKKDLDAYLHGRIKDLADSKEDAPYRASLKAEYGDVNKVPVEPDVPFPVQEPTSTFDAMGQRWEGTGLQKEGSSEATSLMTALDEIELLNTDPLALDKKYADTVKKSQDYVKQFSGTAREPSQTKLANFSSELERLKKAKEAAKDPKKVSEYKAEIQGKLKAALAKRAEGANLVQQADPALSGGIGLARAVTDAGANWKQFLPQIGGTLGGAAAGAMAIETGPGALLAAKVGQAGGAAVFAIPLAYEVYDQAAATVLANGGTTAEARAYAEQQVAVEFGAEIAASMIPGGKALALRTAAKGGAGAGRVATEALKQGARQVVEEELTTDLSQALDMRALGNGDTAAMEATYKQNLPLDENGRFDISRAIDERYQQGLSSLIGGSVQSVPGTIIQNNQLNTKFGELKGAAKEALAQRKEQLQQLGFKGTDLANQLAQDANVLSATAGVDSKDIFNANDFVSEKVDLDQEINAQAKKDLEESIRLRPNDPFTAGQIAGMQLVEQNKNILDTDRFKGTQGWQGQQVSPSAIPLPGDLGAFAVEAPTQSQGYSTATPQPTAEVTVGKPRVNLTERSGAFKPVEQKAPEVKKVTSTENLSLARGKNLTQTRDKLLQDVQKFAGTKIDPKAIDKQKAKIGEALAQAETQLNFEGAFEGLDANQQEDVLRKKALEFLSSGKKIADIKAEFDKATENTPDYRTQNIDAAGRFLTDSDEARTRLAKNIGDPALVDNLIKNGKIVLVPSFEGKKAPDGTVLQDNNQAFIYNGDTIFVNAARLGDKTPRAGEKEVNKELAYAVVAHEYSHKREASENKSTLLKKLTGDKAYQELNNEIEALAKNEGAVGKIARTALARADEGVARGEVKNRSQEAPQYFLEELLLSYNGPLGKLRKYVDLGTSAIRDAYSKVGSIKTVRPQDLAYIIGKDIKREAKSGDKPQPKKTSNADKPKVQNSFVYSGSPKAHKEFREGKGKIDPVYNEPVIEVSDKDAVFDYKKFADQGYKGTLGEVFNHPELYEYYPTLKNAKLVTDKDMRWDAASYQPETNTVTISDKVFNTLLNKDKINSSVHKKILEETTTSIIHEIQHVIQNKRGFKEKGSNLESEGTLYERSPTRKNLTDIQNKKKGAARWAYMANAGEIMARAAEYARKGKMPDGTPVESGLEAAQMIKDQFAKTINSPNDRKDFFEWFDKNIAGTAIENAPILFSTASDVIKNTIKSITNNKYVKGATVGITPSKARIVDERSKNLPKFYEARMNYAIRNLQKTVNKSKVPWEKIDAGWQRMIETKTLKAVTGDKNVDGALADMRIQIANLSKSIRTIFKDAGIPLPKNLDETIEANLWSYISRSFDIDYNRNYGEEYLKEVKKDPSGEKKKKLDNLIRFFQVGLVRDLQNLGTMSDERVKAVHDMLVGSGSPSIEEKRADLKAFVGSRKQTELTEALVNDVLRINKTNKLAGFYRGSGRDTSILKSRKDVPQAIREVWGERTGVMEGAMTTVIRQARLIAETEAQANLLKRIPEDFSKTATNTLTERIDNSVDKYGPLAGMYTTPDMKNYVTERVQQYESADSLLFDIHSAQTQDKASANFIAWAIKQWSKRVGQLKGITVLGEPINYAYNLIGMVQAAAFKGPNSATYTDSKGNKVPIDKWGKQFIYDLIKGEVGPETTELYQFMLKNGHLGSALTGDVQEAFVTELKHTDSAYKKVKNKFGHTINVGFGGPELLSTTLTLLNESNFLRDLWTAQGKKFTHDDVMMEASDRTKRTTISRDRAMVFAKFMDRLGPSTFLTFFTETIRAPITNIIMANQMRKSAETMNPEAAKIAKSYAMRQFVGGVIGLSLTLAMHNMLAKWLGSAFGDEPDEVAEALPEGMRIGADGLLVLGEDNGGVKFLYNPDMANTYSALFDPIKSAIKGNFVDAGKQLLDLQFVNPVIRQAYRAAQGELGPSEDGFTADVNTFLSEIGLANSGFTIPIINVEPFAPQTIARIPKLSAGVEPSVLRPGYDLLTGKKDASDFGGALGLTMTLLGARPYRYAPKKSADWSITKVGEQSKEMVKNLNEVVKNRENSKATIKAQVERFYDEEYEMLQEHYKVIKAAKAAGMTNDELKTLMKGAFLSKTLTASLLNDTGDYYMTEFGASWLEISEMKKVLNMTEKEEAATREGYRRNKEIFFEVFREKFGKKE